MLALRQRGLAAQVLLEMLAPEQITRAIQALLVLAAHRLDRLVLALDLAERIAVFHQGSLIADGTVEAVRNDPRVSEIYLGES